MPIRSSDFEILCACHKESQPSSIVTGVKIGNQLFQRPCMIMQVYTRVIVIDVSLTPFLLPFTVFPPIECYNILFPQNRD
jgi:hypothetical protein